MTKESTLLIYTHPDCPYSAAARDDLDRAGVHYRELDVSKDPDAAQELERLTGGERITPVVVEGGRVTVGYMGVG